MTYKAILFDMDGVIIDSEPLYWAHMDKRLQSIGKRMPKELFMWQVGRSARETAAHIVETLKLDMSPDEYVAFLDFPSMFQKVIDGALDLRLVDGFLELVKSFGGKIPCAIATGSPAMFRETARQKFNLDCYFSAYVSAEEVPAGKPAPDIYLEAARRLGVPIEQCIVIDDAPAGMASGKDAGAYVISTPTKWTGHLSFDRADCICPNLHSVAEHIQSLI